MRTAAHRSVMLAALCATLAGPAQVAAADPQPGFATPSAPHPPTPPSMPHATPLAGPHAAPLQLTAVGPAAATAQPAQEQIGTWTLRCPAEKTASPGCLMRLSRRFLETAGITGDLEVQAQGRTLVPVLILRGVSADLLATAAMAGSARASIQLTGAAREELGCSTTAAGYLCAPDDAAGHRLAAELPAARGVTVRASATIEGLKPLPPQEKSLELSGTRDALTRLRALGPAPMPGPMTGPAMAAQSPAGLVAMADKALKAAGYQDGIASLQALMAKYLKK